MSGAQHSEAKITKQVADYCTYVHNNYVALIFNIHT